MSKEIWLIVGLLIMVSVVLIIGGLISQATGGFDQFVSGLDLVIG